MPERVEPGMSMEGMMDPRPVPSAGPIRHRPVRNAIHCDPCLPLAMLAQLVIASRRRHPLWTIDVGTHLQCRYSALYYVL